MTRDDSLLAVKPRLEEWMLVARLPHDAVDASRAGRIMPGLGRVRS